MEIEFKTIETTADPISKDLLQGTQNMFGMIPNLYAGMANNPALLEIYVSSYSSFRAYSGFDQKEQEVVFLSVALENACGYCIAGHSFSADHFSNLPIEITDAIRNDIEIPDPKYKALSVFTRKVTATRGHVSEEDINNFLNEGYTKNHILGVIAGVSIKTISTYFNHIFYTPLDEAFQSRKWERTSM